MGEQESGTLPCTGADGDRGDGEEYNKHVRINDQLQGLLRDTLIYQCRQVEPTEVSFRSMRKKEQNAVVMGLLTRINNQILKFNVKSLFLVWALYHPEDANSQIIARIIFKKSTVIDVNSVKRELWMKNAKLRRNSTAGVAAAAASGAAAAAAAAASLVSCTADRPTLATHPSPWPKSTTLTHNTRSLSYATLHVADTRKPAMDSVLGKRVRKLAPFCLSTWTNLQLFRAIDSRILGHCSRFFDAPSYRVKDLPVILCYTQYHIDRLIDICKTSRTFPTHLLPSYLRDDVERLLRS